jgi:hypothetical protein
MTVDFEGRLHSAVIPSKVEGSLVGWPSVLRYTTDVEREIL